MIYLLLFQGQVILYNVDDVATDMLLMFGVIKVDHGVVQIANRIFEIRLYNYFLTLPEVRKLLCRSADQKAGAYRFDY